jgi:hypothetical protein
MAKSGSAALNRTKPGAMKVYVEKTKAKKPGAEKRAGSSFELTLQEVKQRGKVLSADIKSLLDRLS